MAKEGKSNKPAGSRKDAKAKPAKGGDAPAAAAAPQGPLPKPRRQVDYEDRVVGELMKRFQYGNIMQVPALKKIVLNMGLGEATQNAKIVDGAVEELSRIAGQKPSVRTAKTSIANFKLREGVAIGAAVTLRGRHMWEFFDRFVSVAVPRIRDFRGFSSRAFDGRGNYSVGIAEQIIFPEIDYDKVDKIRGLNITLVTSAKTDEEGLELLRSLKFPFRERTVSQ